MNRRQIAMLGLAAFVGATAIADAQTSRPADKPVPTPMMTAMQKPPAKPRVFFIEPKDGATLTSPVHMKFGAEGVTIGQVPPGEITKIRPGMAHYHIGIEQDCLPAGKNIVKGTPSWVHFGDGTDVFDVQLTPGKHKLALQLGDDKHDTMPGTCQVITVNVK